MQKRVLLINSLTFGGAEKVITVIITELINQGFEVDLVFLEHDNFYKVPEKVNIHYLSNLKGDENGIIKFLSIPLLGWRLKNYIKKNNVTIVQSHTFRANYINLFSKLLRSNHESQVVNHGIASRYESKGILGKINLFLIKSLYPKADIIITISKMMQLDLSRIIKYNRKQLIINNPYDIFRIKVLKKEKVEGFNFDKKNKYLISVGRLISLKRYSDILKAFECLPKNIHFILLGEGEGKEKLQEIVKKLDVAERVHFLGLVQNPFKYISRSDILILASETEGFPNVLIEAMICNTPIISSDCISGPREILAPKTDVKFQLKDNIEIAEYGVLYPVGDTSSLEKAINLLLEDKKLRDNYKRKAFIRARDFSKEKIVSQYKEVLGLEK